MKSHIRHWGLLYLSAHICAYSRKIQHDAGSRLYMICLPHRYSISESLSLRRHAWYISISNGRSSPLYIAGPTSSYRPALQGNGHIHKYSILHDAFCNTLMNHFTNNQDQCNNFNVPICITRTRRTCLQLWMCRIRMVFRSWIDYEIEFTCLDIAIKDDQLPALKSNILDYLITWRYSTCLTLCYQLAPKTIRNVLVTPAVPEVSWTLT